MLTNDELAGFLAVGNETRALEFKGPTETGTKEYLAKVARAALAMANQRDGGYIIIGVVDGDTMGSMNGLDEGQVSNWSSHDWVTDKINRYADPPLTIQVEVRSHPAGKPLVVIQVSEFSEVPSICSRDSISGILKMGQLYTRSIRKPESSNYHSQNEVRELLDLATSKGLRRFMDTARLSGIAVDRSNSAWERYKEQLDSLETIFFGSGLTIEPHFRHIIYPLSYVTDRVEYNDLISSVRESTVRMRGWPFPFVQDPSNDQDFVSEVVSFERHWESWMFFTSGLFADYRKIGIWSSDGDSFGANDDPRIQGNMPIWLGLLFFTEAMEFAVRLRGHLKIDEPMVVRFEGQNLTGQRLVVANDNRAGFSGNYIFGGSSWSSKEFIVDDDAVINGTRGMAVDAAFDLISRFGWAGVTKELLSGLQAETFDR